MSYFIYDDLALFINLVESGSITTAAQQQNLSRITFSKRIKVLESQLGVKLHQFNNSQLELTAEGKNIYAKFASNMHQIQKLFNETNYDNKDELIGTLRVAMPGALMTYVLAPHIAMFLKDNPKVSLNIRYLTLGQSDLVSEQFDIAICNNIPKLQSVKIKKLGEENLKLYAQHSYLAKHTLPSSLEELTQHRMIGYLYAKEPLNKLTVTNLKTAQEIPFSLSASVYVDNLLSIQNLIKNGDYLALLPSKIGDNQVVAGQLLEVLPQFSFFSYQRYLVLNAGTRSHLEHEFVKFLENVWQHRETY